MATIPASTYAAGTVHTIPARSGVAVALKKDQTIKVINTYGSQVVDFWSVSPDLKSYLSMARSRAFNLHLSPLVDDTLIDNYNQEMLKFIEDRTPSGIHDTLIAACDLERYRRQGVPKDTYHENCSDNYRSALKNDMGIVTDAPPPDPLNLFMNIPVHPVETMSTAMSIEGNRANQDGVTNTTAGSKLSFEAPVCRPGDWVKMRALVDCVVVMSACPQDIIKINNQDPRDAHFLVE